MVRADAEALESDSTSGIARVLRFAYLLTTFVSAFLLFQVQPLISKFILPWFGGTPSLWTTCMLFFQILLFAGYAYAHLLTVHLRPRTQLIVHVILISAALATLPIIPDPSWKVADAGAPTLRVLLVLASTVGLPFFVLSTTGPLIQRWFSETHPQRSAYRLYALSNLSSLLALISYPLLVEPIIATRMQAVLWSGGFVLFAAGCACSVVGSSRLRCVGDTKAVSTSVAAPANPPTRGTMLLWLALVAVPSLMLLASTNQVCLDIVSVPFLWVIPLTLYLLSFILCFDSDRWYVRGLFVGLLPVSVVAITWVLAAGNSVGLVTQVVTHFIGLFVIAMCCHGELARTRPNPEYLTRYYLLISAGGAFGGIYVGLIAPLIHSGYVELNVGLFAALVVVLTACYRDEGWVLRGPQARFFAYGTVVTLAVLGFLLGENALSVASASRAVTRNFYGVLRVEEHNADDDHTHFRVLKHGRITHGVQFLAPTRRNSATTYYGPASGVGRALAATSSRPDRRIGAVGLGTGTLAVYGRPRELLRFYEINPEVVRLAREHFTFLGDCTAKVEIVLGDARISLEREDPQQFDVLAVDAFTGDAVPAHLLTREAFAVYLRHLAEDGLLAIHVSNRHLDLIPVVVAGAAAVGLHGRVVEDARQPEQEIESSTWVVLARDAKSLDSGPLAEFESLPRGNRILWTDDFSNLLDVVRFSKNERER